MPGGKYVHYQGQNGLPRHTGRGRRRLERIVILVETGVYNEQITITKSCLKIIGEGEAVLNGKFLLNNGFTLRNVTGVKIKSFRMMNFRNDGIYVTGGSDNVIAKNQIENNNYFGIEFSNSSYNQAYANALTGNYYGIYIYSRNDRIEANLKPRRRIQRLCTAYDTG